MAWILLTYKIEQPVIKSYFMDNAKKGPMIIDFHFCCYFSFHRSPLDSRQQCSEMLMLSNAQLCSAMLSNAQQCSAMLSYAQQCSAMLKSLKDTEKGETVAAVATTEKQKIGSDSLLELRHLRPAAKKPFYTIQGLGLYICFPNPVCIIMCLNSF